MGQMMPRIVTGLFLACALCAAATPLVVGRAASTSKLATDFPGWPAAYEGRPLQALPLTPREDFLLRDFPGKVGRFTDGRRELIIRWVGAPTRLLHPASDCFKALGYSIAPLPARTDSAGRFMSCAKVTKAGASLAMCEIIVDQRQASMADVSAWYWGALWGTTTGPWWSFVVAEPM
jgi:hypothetical protein